MGLRLGSQVIPTVRLYRDGVKYPTGVIDIDASSSLASDSYDVTNYAFANVTNIPEATDYFAQYATDTLVSYSNSNITSLPAYAFYGRSNLEEVIFPACTTINYSAFQSCSSLTTVSFPACIRIYSYAFANCSSLTTINFPACASISGYAFRSCPSLTSVNFPACTYIATYAFANCSSLTSVNFPVCASIGAYAFQYCSSLTTASFPVCISISTYVFRYCYNLLSLYLLGSSLCFLGTTTAFSSTPISTYTTSTGGVYGSIYVPASLLASYQTATNWVYYSSRFVGV